MGSIGKFIGASIVATVAICIAGCASRPTPIAYRPITIDAHCAQREEDGFREDARLSVSDNRVQLVARDGSGCRLFVWQEPGRVTLAHADCEARCAAGIYDEAWPVSFDPSSGACAVIR